MPWDPKELTPKHEKLIREYVSGKDIKEAAELVGFSETQAYKVINSEAGQEAVGRMKERIMRLFCEAEGNEQAIKKHREHAAAVFSDEDEAEAKNALRELMRSGPASAKLKSAKEILALRGVQAPPKKQEVDVGVSVKMDEDFGFLAKKLLGEVGGLVGSSEDFEGDEGEEE